MSSDGPYWPDGFFAELLELAEAGDLQDDLNAERLDAMYQRAAEELTRPVIENPGRALAEERGQRAGFEARLAARWGRPLDLFDLTVEQALEAGRWINTRWRPRAAACQDQKFEALIRLHGRAVMTANEVQVLLRAGYSTGALARWRTIHEIWVVSSVLGDHDQEVSRRYLVHNAVESMKGEEEYEETWEALGFEPPDWTLAKRDELRASLRDDFGEPFLRDYGWAAPLFGDRAPRFRQIQELAALDHWRGYYRMASHGTHANPKGISWNIQGSGRADVIWAGPSNAGLVDPAQCTLIALANVTVGLLRYAVNELMTGDDELPDQCLALVRQQAVLVLMDRAIEAFAATHDKQEREEETLGELITRAQALLGEQPLLTGEQLADLLEVDAEVLAEALEAGVARGLIAADRRYFINSPKDDEQSADSDEGT